MVLPHQWKRGRWRGPAGCSPLVPSPRASPGTGGDPLGVAPQCRALKLPPALEGTRQVQPLGTEPLRVPRHPEHTHQVQPLTMDPRASPGTGGDGPLGAAPQHQAFELLLAHWRAPTGCSPSVLSRRASPSTHGSVGAAGACWDKGARKIKITIMKP